MRHQEASIVVDVPMSEVERQLSDVETWPAFLVGVDAVERLGHERYRFHLADGKDARDSTVCVRHFGADHCFRWKSLAGPHFSGSLELRAVDGRHTRVRLSLTSHPGTFLAGVAEMLLPRMARAEHDLRNLDSLLARR